MGHFELQHTRRDGSIITKEPIRCNTETGVILNCHPKADTAQIKRLCELARETPDYPIDLSAWRETTEGKILEWSARLFYRQGEYDYEYS